MASLQDRIMGGSVAEASQPRVGQQISRLNTLVNDLHSISDRIERLSSRVTGPKPKLANAPTDKSPPMPTGYVNELDALIARFEMVLDHTQQEVATLEHSV